MGPKTHWLDLAVKHAACSPHWWCKSRCKLHPGASCTWICTTNGANPGAICTSIYTNLMQENAKINFLRGLHWAVLRGVKLTSLRGLDVIDLRWLESIECGGGFWLVKLSRVNLLGSFDALGIGPFFCESRFGALKVANRRLEAIRANRSNVMKIGSFSASRFVRMDLGEAARFPDSRCDSPGYLSWDIPDPSWNVPDRNSTPRLFLLF